MVTNTWGTSTACGMLTTVSETIVYAGDLYIRNNTVPVTRTEKVILTTKNPFTNPKKLEYKKKFGKYREIRKTQKWIDFRPKVIRV